MSLGGRPDAPRATCSTQKPCLYGIPSWQWQKVGCRHKKLDLGPKNCIFWAVLGLKIRFFLRYANLTPLFRLRRTRLNGIITSPCPEVTLDTFGFPVGARSAARRAVFWHRLPKMVLFGAKNAVFSAPNPFFCDVIQLFCHFHDGTPKMQGFCVEPVAQWASGRPPRPIFGPKILIFLRYTHITLIFWGRTDPTQLNHKYPISWGNFG